MKSQPETSRTHSKLQGLTDYNLHVDKEGLRTRIPFDIPLDIPL